MQDYEWWFDMTESMRFMSGDLTHVIFTGHDGVEWSGIPVEIVAGTISVTSDGEIPRKAQEWLDAGNTPTDYELPPLETVKARLLVKLNEDAEAYRQQFITPGDGMAMTYREKFEQAKAVVAAGQAAADAMTDGEAYDAYPTLFASVGREAQTLWACAQLVITRAEAWADLSHDIEAKRMDGKAAIEAASTVAEAESAYASITWE